MDWLNTMTKHRLGLSEEEKKANLAWCRNFLDHNCIFRSPSGNSLLVTKTGGLNSWQFYLPIAVLNQEFGYRIARLFWDLFIDDYETQKFQLCGCETGGSLLLTVLQSVAYEAGIAVNVFSIKKERKSYGIKNWCEGQILENLPVMMIDDVIASGQTLKTQAKRIAEMDLDLFKQAFCIAACKPQAPTELKIDNKAISLHVIFKPNDFAVNWGQYRAKYGRNPVFNGILL